MDFEFVPNPELFFIRILQAKLRKINILLLKVPVGPLKSDYRVVTLFIEKKMVKSISHKI